MMSTIEDISTELFVLSGLVLAELVAVSLLNLFLVAAGVGRRHADAVATTLVAVFVGIQFFWGRPDPMSLVHHPVATALSLLITLGVLWWQGVARRDLWRWEDSLRANASADAAGEDTQLGRPSLVRSNLALMVMAASLLVLSLSMSSMMMAGVFAAR